MLEADGGFLTVISVIALLESFIMVKLYHQLLDIIFKVKPQ